MLHLGDSKILLKDLEENSIDCCVTDPPYGLTDEKSGFHRGKANQFTRTAKGGFMGKRWDGSGIEYSIDFWKEVYRVLKPGAYLLAFGGSRTYHRLACAIEDAGFEIRDMIQWIYGSGFPKALDVSKAIDKMKGVERKVTKVKQHAKKDFKNNLYAQDPANANNNKVFGYGAEEITLPATPEAKYWEGWKSALKPAHEPICVARKPLDGTIAENCLKWGVGAMNIDGCRVDFIDNEPDKRVGTNINYDGNTESKFFKTIKNNQQVYKQGRFPSNVIFDEEAAKMLDEQSGVLKSGDRKPVNNKPETLYKLGLRQSGINNFESSSGGASRFFYCAKASRTERNAGLEGMEEKTVNKLNSYGNQLEYESSDGSRRKGNKGSAKMQNHHPTVKPISLMEYLIKLVSREGQTVLDPFAGSGTTGIACINLNREFIGFEKEPEYVEIAERRIEYWKKQNYKPQIKMEFAHI